MRRFTRVGRDKFLDGGEVIPEQLEVMPRVRYSGLDVDSQAIAIRDDLELQGGELVLPQEVPHGLLEPPHRASAILDDRVDDEVACGILLAERKGRTCLGGDESRDERIVDVVEGLQHPRVQGVLRKLEGGGDRVDWFA
jgi:hypothetical protein